MTCNILLCTYLLHIVFVLDISNVKFHCAKAEDVMKDITKSVIGSSHVVAIVDPPRGGLRKYLNVYPGLC